jgi:hypothetical protein
MNDTYRWHVPKAHDFERKSDMASSPQAGTGINCVNRAVNLSLFIPA